MFFRGPAVVMGVIMLAYWSKVGQLVYRNHVRTGKAGNAVPREAVGRWLRLIWGPIVAVWIGEPLAVGFARRVGVFARPIVGASGFRPTIVADAGGPIVGWFAVAIGLIAFSMTWMCWRQMGRSWRMGIDPNEKTRLVVNGPYAYVRHPIYALSILLMICTVLAVPSPLMLIVGALHWGLMVWEARREEGYLLVTHGAAYAEYCDQVGRFFPSGRRRVAVG